AVRLDRRPSDDQSGGADRQARLASKATQERRRVTPPPAAGSAPGRRFNTLLRGDPDVRKQLERTGMEGACGGPGRRGGGGNAPAAALAARGAAAGRLKCLEVPRKDTRSWRVFRQGPAASKTFARRPAPF